MTPQQRHIEAARLALSTSWFSVAPSDLVEAISAAIAEAENRAAWDGREFGSRETGHHLCGSPTKCAEVYREFVSKYGPCPTKETDK